MATVIRKGGGMGVVTRTRPPTHGRGGLKAPLGPMAIDDTRITVEGGLIADRNRLLYYTVEGNIGP